eukprot:TRINITY_DN15349_c0_g1_i1.p1 TRINITY_DN15349_c0_g1~~TRINITY_DN15349_c0_g1_i1.p1  ORF type:complete len:340 (-),score=68.12 TRINITY_DN15349_c0_g1_i1:89-1048(-)
MAVRRLVLIASVAVPTGASRLRRAISTVEASVWTSSRLGLESNEAVSVAGDDWSCGALSSYPNARPKKFEDSQKTYYNATEKKTKPKVYSSGDSIEFECDRGFTTDGSKDGDTTFQVLCNDLGYFKPDGVCLKASKCGSVPNISNAVPTGEENGNDVEMSCIDGYSLDGKEVVAGGFGKNRLFTLKCVEFSGEYEQFTGECKPYSFVPARESARIYNHVFEALFVVSCKGTLKKAFRAGKGPGVDQTCAKIEDSTLQGQCEGLVSKIKSDFTKQAAAREAYDEAAGKDWYEKEGPDRPGIHDEADEFCTELWKLLEYTQ